MSLLIYNRFGGRQRRYKTIPGTLVEILDPWECRTISLSGLWQRDLWLLCRSDPSVEAVIARPVPLEYLELGHRYQGVADLAVRQQGRLTYHSLMLVESAKAVERHARLTKATRAHKVLHRIWRLDDLDQRASTLQNMGHVRQSLAVWLDHDLSAVQRVILTHIEAGPRTCGELRTGVKKSLGTEGTLPFDAALFRLYFNEYVSLDMNRRYDDESCVACL